MKTEPQVIKIDVPGASALAAELGDSDYYDCYELGVDDGGRSAMQIYLDVVADTPGWVEALMTARNRIVSLAGLKNLGQLGGFDASRPADSYRPGDRVGIFTLLYLSEEEIVLGDSDKHLKVKVSVRKQNKNERHSIAVSTVVHIHNTLGRLYMLFVAPAHRVIVPAVLARSTPK